MRRRVKWSLCLVLSLFALGACGERREAPAPVTVHGQVLGGPPPGRVSQPLPPSAEPDRAPPPAEAGPDPRLIPGGRVKVQAGETIYDVSRRTGAPVRELIDANHIKPPYKIAAGTVLVVPGKRHHVVKPGETLNSIAAAEGVEIFSLARMNELTRPFAVKPGQVLILPPGAEGVAREEEAPPGPPPPGVKPAPPQPGGAPPPPPEKPQPGQRPPPPQQAGPETLPAPPPRGGNFLWPVKGKIIGRYGTAASGAHNDGINIAAPKGTPVKAADAGVVAYAGNELRGYGNLILIKHSGGYMTAYAHNDTILVKRGDTVKRGQEIAKVGSTGIAGEPQLHFEIRQGTKVLDPDQYLAGT